MLPASALLQYTQKDIWGHVPGTSRVGTHWPGAQATHRRRTRKLSVGWGSPDQSEMLILSPHIDIHKVHRNTQQGSYTGRHSIQGTTYRFSHILPNTHTHTPCLHHRLVEEGHLKADCGARQGLSLARAELRDFSFCSIPSSSGEGVKEAFEPLPLNPGFNLCGEPGHAPPGCVSSVLPPHHSPASVSL